MRKKTRLILGILAYVLATCAATAAMVAAGLHDAKDCARAAHPESCT